MLALELDGLGSLQTQLYRALRLAILERRLHGGQRLPGTRALAREQAVARNTVLAVYAQLEAEGYLRARLGSGFVVLALPARQPRQAGPAARSAAVCTDFAQRAAAQVGPRIAASVDPPPRLDLRYGLPLAVPQLLSAWRRVLSWAADRAPLDYPPVAGLPVLRRALADWLGRRRGFSVDPQHILIVSGAQQAIDLCVRVLAVPGCTAVIEDPHYQGTRQALSSAGVSWRALAVDPQGLSLDELPEHQAALLFLTPAHQFPSGAVLAPARRLAILQWAQRNAAWVIEDDYDSEYRYDAAPVPALKSLDLMDRVIHVGTLSKALFPALRLGFMVLPAALFESFAAVKWLSDRGNGAIEQLALARLIESGRFEALLRMAVRQLAKRRAALIAALSEQLQHLGLHIEGSSAGMHVCVWLDQLPADSSSAVIAAAYAQGVGVYPVTPYYLNPPPMLGLLLGYAGLPPSEIVEAVRRLRGVLEACAVVTLEKMQHGDMEVAEVTE